MTINFKAQPKHPYLLVIGLFLVFVGVRIHLIMLNASQTPYWDDWSMGARMAMFVDSGLDLTWLYGLTNEHRATFSKIINLSLFYYNDQQWDPYLTMVFNTFLWAAAGVFLIRLGFREYRNISPWLFMILVIILWTYPLSLFNTLSTIQTYVYCMILSVICGFWLVTDRVFSLKWCVGVLLMLAACMTTAGGSFAPVAVVSVSLFLLVCGKQSRIRYLVNAGVLGLVSAFGIYLILNQGGSNFVGSTSASDFMESLFKTLSWPSSHKVWPSVIFLLPVVLLALGLLRKKIKPSRIAMFSLLMAAFGIMLSIAIAHARGAEGYGPAERYFDFLTIYLVSSTLSLMLIQGDATGYPKALVRGLTVLWVCMCLLAIPYHLRVSRYQLNDRAKLVPIQDDIMARYSVNYDPSVFEDREFRQVPYPSKKGLQGIMNQLNETDTLPYSLQFSSMSLVNGDTFVVDGVVESEKLYRGLEHVVGSYNTKLGGQGAKGEHTSEVFSAKRPYLMVPVSGHLGVKSMSLTLIGVHNGVKVSVSPRNESSHDVGKWHEVLVKAPDSKYRIEARDESVDHWFAYAAPRSVGRLSFIADRVISAGDKIWLVGLILVLFGFRSDFFQLIRSLRSEHNIARNG